MTLPQPSTVSTTVDGLHVFYKSPDEENLMPFSSFIDDQQIDEGYDMEDCEDEDEDYWHITNNGDRESSDYYRSLFSSLL